MLIELEKYKNHGSFEYYINEELNIICKAPKMHGGVYLVYSIDSEVELIYIGCSGWVNQDGSFSIRKNGMYDRIVNGDHTFQINGIMQTDKRKNIWPIKMCEDKINRLRVDWYVTFIDDVRDIPAYTESILIQRYFEKQGNLPRWNKEF
jgi:hypothetical protein